MLALPLLSVTGEEMYFPLPSVTMPVGIALPLPPLIATVTVNACPVVMLKRDGVTETAGEIFGGTVTFTEAVPEAGV